jgi:aminoglycoside phosphotransferase (APT) family kinase protein
MVELPQLGRRIGFAVLDALIELHSLDPKVCDLEGLGKSQGFVERQVRGWQKRWAAVSNDDDKSDIERAGRRLSLRLPTSDIVAIIHNDFKVDNCQFDPTNPDCVKSIFDWDMVTIGDPLVDLGILLNYWPDEGDDAEDGPVFPIGLDLLGLPGRREIREYYASKTGLSLENIAWYEAFACWKTGIVAQQLYARFVRGETADRRMETMESRVHSQGRRANVILDSIDE